MKRRLLVATIVLLVCGGCVGYYQDPYSYNPYPYQPYYYPSYRPPAAYYNPGWMFFYPSISVGTSYRGYYGYQGYRGYHGYRGPYRPYRHGGGRR